MPTRHTVEEGDTVIGLSERHGFLANTIWDDGANAGLREVRADMNILMPGDVVVIPDRRKKFEKRATGAVHRFRRRGVPAIFRLQLFQMNVPVANQPYVLKVNGVEKPGTTDAQGIVEQFVPAGAKTGELLIGEGGSQVKLPLQFGWLDPINEISGVQNRLENLGYPCGKLGTLDDATKQALLDFQRDNQLERTGEIDDATTAKLQEIYDEPYQYPEPSAGAAS